MEVTSLFLMQRNKIKENYKCERRCYMKDEYIYKAINNTIDDLEKMKRKYL